MRRLFAVFALAVVVTAGCSKASRGSASARSNSNLVTSQELASVPDGNLYDALQRLRPSLLRPRSTASSRSALPEVFVDGLRRGSPEYLLGINSRQVVEVRYLSAIDATTRYGLNVPAGVIDVTLITR